MPGGVLDPQGPIAAQEKSVIIIALIIMLVVAVPMLITFFTIAWKYRAGRKHSEAGKDYQPQHVGTFWKQIAWWMILAAAIACIAVLNWQSTHAVDPYKPLAATAGADGMTDAQPLTIEVVALPWKWLFIYPQQGIAAVNYVEFPAGTPIHFDITADGPMSIFWIPQLGTQIAAMSTMQTQLNLMASVPGEFAGKNSEINGDGYSGMLFTAHAVSTDDFNNWVASMRADTADPALTVSTYATLAVPSKDNPPAAYSSVDPDLYATILKKYTTPETTPAPAVTQLQTP